MQPVAGTIPTAAGTYIYRRVYSIQAHNTLHLQCITLCVLLYCIVVHNGRVKISHSSPTSSSTVSVIDSLSLSSATYLVQRL